MLTTLVALFATALAAEPSTASQLEPFDGPNGEKSLPLPAPHEDEGGYLDAWLAPGDTALVAAGRRYVDIFPLQGETGSSRVPYEVQPGESFVPRGPVDADRFLVERRMGEQSVPALVNIADGSHHDLDLGRRYEGFRVRNMASGPALVALCVSDPDDAGTELVLFDVEKQKVRWSREIRCGGYAGAAISLDGEVVNYDEDYFSATKGKPTRRRWIQKRASISVPSDHDSRLTLRSADESTVLQLTTAGDVYAWPTATLDPASAEVNEAIVRVRAAPPVRRDQLIGHWQQEAAMIKLYDRSEQDFETSDWHHWIGKGGFGIQADGVMRAGLLQVEGTWTLSKDGKTLRTIDPKGREMNYAVRVDGDMMEWVQSEEPINGDFRVELYLRLKRDR